VSAGVTAHVAQALEAARIYGRLVADSVLAGGLFHSAC
jgi:hypothetical protein